VRKNERKLSPLTIEPMKCPEWSASQIYCRNSLSPEVIFGKEFANLMMQH
jgi:hypothetical protein